MFVIGCTVDYITELGGSYLKVINLGHLTSCGCGESFIGIESRVCMNINVN